MNSPFIFRIHPLGIEEGFELSCEGVLPQALQVKRLYDAVIYALHIGRDLEGELHLFDSFGRLSETYPLHPVLPFSVPFRSETETAYSTDFSSNSLAPSICSAEGDSAIQNRADQIDGKRRVIAD